MNPHLNLFSISGLLIVLSSSVFGLFVYLQDPKKPLYRLWFIFFLSVAIWGLGSFFSGTASSAQWAKFSWKIGYVGVVFVPALFYHFVGSFIGLTRKKSLIFIYFISLIFLILNFSGYIISDVTWLFGEFYFFAPPGPALPYFLCYFIGIVVIGHYELWSHMIDAQHSSRRQQIKWFLFSTVIGFTGGFSCYLPTYNFLVYPYGNFLVVLYPILMSYAILKHQLMDIRVVVKKTFFYTFWTLVISIFYALAIVLMQGTVSGKGLFASRDWGDVSSLAYRWSGVIALATNTGLAFFVLARNFKSELCRRFFSLSLFIGFWAAGSWLVNIIPEKDIALRVLKINYAFGVFVPVLFLHFIYTLTKKKGKLLLRCGYGISAILAALLFLSPYFIEALRLIDGFNFCISLPGPCYFLFVGYFCTYFLTAFGIMIHALKQASKEKATQLGYVLLAYIVGMTAGCEYFLAVYGVLKRPPLDDFILILTFGILSYAISRHALLDIRVVVKKTLFYSLLVFAISTAYIFVIFITHKFFVGDVFTKKHLIANLALILFITLLLRPVENFLRRQLDKKFFKGTIDEISEQKEKLETELERRERLKSVGILAAGMAHEIKNPITAIQTFAEYLPKKYNDPEFRESFSRLITFETKRVSEIIRDLLLFASPSDPKPEVCDIYKIIKSTTDLMSAEFARHQIEIDLAIDPNDRCFADGSQIKQAILNIVINAIDAMKGCPKRNLLIATRSDTGFLELSIKDTGVGISVEKIPHLFDPFYTDKESGTGLGLAITYSIIQKNFGKIEVESVMGEGTVFKIYLPRRNRS